MANNTAESSGIRLPWAGKSVRIEEVEERLATFWRGSADNLRTGANIHVRTSVLNLVICAPDIDSAKYASSLLRELTSTHLARVSILILDNNEQAFDGVSAWVTLRCYSIISDLMRHCFEQTTLLISGSARRAAANILYPLLKSHLPVYLWWIGDPPGQADTTFEKLVKISDRVIVDSTGFFEPELDIQELASLFETHPECALSDMNWARITPWRQRVTQFFGGPDYEQHLEGIESIEIEHVAAPLATPTRTEQGEVSLNPTHALLMAAWLKTYMNWTLAPGSAHNQRDSASGAYQWDMTRPSTREKASKQGTIIVRPRVQSEVRPGAIYLVRLTSQIDNKRTVFTIQRDADPDYIVTTVESPGARTLRTVSLAAVRKESALLRDELEITMHDEPFEAALLGVAELLGGLEVGTQTVVG